MFKVERVSYLYTSFNKMILGFYKFYFESITGTDHIAGLGECERLLSESHGFLFYGTERILSYFNSSKISSFNLGIKNCRTQL